MTNFELINLECKTHNAKLIVVSKQQEPENVLKLYSKGHRMFAENKVQALILKKELLPVDIEWHMIGHLQTNKVKQIVPFISCIQSVDSFDLALEINKQAQKISRVIPILLQIKISKDDNKFGFDINELKKSILADSWHLLNNLSIDGVMGIGSLVSDNTITREEFRQLYTYFDEINKISIPKFKLKEISMGMSGDYKIALEEGSTMIRVGSLAFSDIS